VAPLEIFNDPLPTYPDNINFNAGICWLGIPDLRGAQSFAILLPKPILIKILLLLSANMIDGGITPNDTRILGFDETRGNSLYLPRRFGNIRSRK
tara:strand:- start:207 stop:491 length:285 start_codon:yes stop_codon:yes gene_type:complete